MTVSYLVVIVEIDPPPQTLDGVPPFGRVGHHDGPALGIVLFDAHLLDSVARRKAQSLVDFVLDGDPVRVPAEAAADVVALHGPVPRDNVFDGGGEEVAIVRQSWGCLVDTRNKG